MRLTKLLVMLIVDDMERTNERHIGDGFRTKCGDIMYTRDDGSHSRRGCGGQRTDDDGITIPCDGCGEVLEVHEPSDDQIDALRIEAVDYKTIAICDIALGREHQSHVAEVAPAMTAGEAKRWVADYLSDVAAERAYQERISR